MDYLIFKTIFGWVYAEAGDTVPAATQHGGYHKTPLAAVEAAFQHMSGVKKLGGVYVTSRVFRDFTENQLREIEQAHPNPIFVDRDNHKCLLFT